MKKGLLVGFALMLVLMTGCVQSSTSKSRQHKPNAHLKIDARENYKDQLHRQMPRNTGGKVRTKASAVQLTLDGIVMQVSPAAYVQNDVVYIPLSAVSTLLSASVWTNASSNTIGINQGDKRIAFFAGGTSAVVDGVRKTMPASQVVLGTTFVPVRFLAESLGYTVTWDAPTQALAISTKPPVQQGVTVTYTTYAIQAGDTMWDISIKFGIPMLELLKLNNMGINDPLSLGQPLKIPIYHVPVKTTAGPAFGELLDWWTEARYVFPVGATAVVTDFVTKRTFRVKYTMGGNHADCEPVSAADATTMKSIWGGAYSWTPRAVIVTINGRKLAAASHSYPHDGDSIADNNYPGHFCIHFLHSTRHVDGLEQASMQKQVHVAAGM
jgi:LysM repeat protein